jgi:hypothetical protein
VRNRPSVAATNLELAKKEGLPITPDGKLILFHGTRSGDEIRHSRVINVGSYLAVSEKVAQDYAEGALGAGRAEVMKVEVSAGVVFPSGMGGQGRYFSANEPIDIRGKGTAYV